MKVWQFVAELVAEVEGRPVLGLSDSGIEIVPQYPKFYEVVARLLKAGTIEQINAAMMMLENAANTSEAEKKRKGKRAVSE